MLYTNTFVCNFFTHVGNEKNCNTILLLAFFLFSFRFPTLDLRGKATVTLNRETRALEINPGLRSSVLLLSSCQTQLFRVTVH